MKAHTTGFKNAVKELGRQLRAVITYGNVTLEEEIYAVTPHFEGGILKSIMKQLDLELSVDIPLETVLNCQIGILVNGNYEMLNFGNYVVYKSEKQEDTNTYRLTCYDKMLYSMKQNEELNITYPISIKNYLTAICNKLGLTLETTTFQNESRMIQDELYLGLDYTYRDILDEIAQATGSIICLNENDRVLVKYPTQTNDTIDEEFLKDVNVDFGQMYGAINTIVLSRSGESDNIYYPETLPENPIEIKIKDNQIMNWNDRSDYLPGIYNALNGLYYYINDFSSTGIMYYEVGDLYNVQVGNNTYQCLMLNDEINITTGIEEIIHTDLPEESETDYTKADKTDRKINQTYLIVDKQNQSIEALISTQTEQNQKIARVTQTVDELNSKISDIADITTSLETNSARLEFEGINQSEPVRVVIHPIGVNISKLYPSTSLKPSTNLTIKTRILRFTNTTTEEVFDYELPDDLLYYDSENYDEFILDYESLTCIVNKKCKWNNNGTVGLLTNERTDEYTFPHIELTDGDYTVSLIQYNNGYMFVRLMAQNIYTTQFATKAEVNSDIRQTVDNINLSVNEKLTNYSTTTEMNSAIDLKANQITSSVSETYATKSELNSSTSSLNSKIDQTASSISLSVDSVQEQVETAQSTANSAVTKADNAQSSANSAQTTANSATTKANNAQTSANNAQATANNINNNLTTNYYTKTETNSAINQKADSITSTVSQTYSTKTETTAAKNAAINSANASTDAKLQNYSTTSQMNSAIIQKANEISARIDQIEDVTNEVNGTKTVTLTNCVKGSVLELHIYGNNSVFQAMYPTNTLYPQDNLYPKGDSLITVQYANNTTKTYELGVTEVLRKNGSVYDEYVLESGQAQVIRRINSNGTVKTTPTTQNLGEFSIVLEEGTNTITIKNYSADMYVKYAIKSAYTDIFATQVQMNSSITQTAEEINLEVSKKVDSNEVISKINQSAEAVGINANKINLSANDVLNLLSGNTINLSGKSIKIASNNFSVDENGKMSCSNANITGGNFNVAATSTNTDTLRITNKNNTNEYMYASPGMIQLKTSQGRSFMTVKSGSSDHSYLILENGDTAITITEEGIICPNIYNNLTTSNIPNMQIGSNGQIRRSTNTSTRKHKTEIKNLTDKELNPEKLYDLEIKQFKYKKEYQPSEKDNRYNKTLVGFIAEDVEKIYPIATDYDENKEIENWNERYIIPPMLKLIQDQHKQIGKMQEEIEKLRKEIEK